ncbi:MAG: hypothetical protein A2X12_00905 [Bacteroidetes bacterium GWE2_29_8]|nr:MAG: hypothetical protein A2X12_00905 [Bacteroidetes bacterium GWE2_29_8]OFY15636.1 MAG: hypothetical protein A2X02_06375 [Bacteroidetes bacterium GWF2_29_10]
MSANFILTVIIVFYIVDFLIEQLVSFLDDKNNNASINPELKGVYDEDKYAKSLKYNHQRYLFGLFKNSFSFIILLLCLLYGVFGNIETMIMSAYQNKLIVSICFFGIIFLFSEIISLPLSYYSTFVIEHKFGFNKTNLKTFLTDKLKSMLIAFIIGTLIFSVLIFSLGYLGKNFWVLFWVFSVLFTIFISEFYTVLIVPIFNKLLPLEDGDLRDAIKEFANKVNFKIDNIFVIDSSRRSSKSNAYFSGLGKKKKIVIYDTLIKNHTKEEIVAIIAHEIGHYKHKHTIKGLIMSFVQTGFILYLLSFAIFNSNVSIALGGTGISYNLGLIAFGLLFSPISLLFGILSNFLSRKFEYEADKYVDLNYETTHFIAALKKLYSDNLSNINPHKLNVFLNYSHPTLLQRIMAFKK